MAKRNVRADSRHEFSVRYVPWLIFAAVFGALLLAQWVTWRCADTVSCRAALVGDLYDWQALVAGVLALLAGIVILRAIYLQTSAHERAGAERRARLIRAYRAGLSDDLAAITKYALKSAEAAHEMLSLPSRKSCVTQGMKNKEIALRVGTTEQVVKNYLRKVYDKLGVADRLELALYCLNHHVVDNTKVPPLPVSPSVPPTNGKAANAAAAGASASGGAANSAAPNSAGSNSSSISTDDAVSPEEIN